MSDYESENDVPKGEYRGNKIPIVIKIAWPILISWCLYYLIRYSLPNLLKWIE